MSFTVQMQNGIYECRKEFELNELVTPDWDQLLWGVPINTSVPGGIAFFTQNSVMSPNFDCGGFAPWVPGGDTSGITNIAQLPYNGPATNCNVHIQIIKAAINAADAPMIQGIVNIDILTPFNVNLLNKTYAAYALGTYVEDLPFTVPDTGGANWTIEVGLIAVSIPIAPPVFGQNLQLEFHATISNV